MPALMRQLTMLGGPHGKKRQVTFKGSGWPPVSNKQKTEALSPPTTRNWRLPASHIDAKVGPSLVGLDENQPWLTSWFQCRVERGEKSRLMMQSTTRGKKRNQTPGVAAFWSRFCRVLTGCRWPGPLSSLAILYLSCSRKGCVRSHAEYPGCDIDEWHELH